MAATNKISNTIQEFREEVMARGGPQIASMYEVILSHVNQPPLVCYPLSVIIPGRQFIFYEHDIWGTARKIPYKRGYTQCHMSFIVYQDFNERTYIENWMNSVIVNTQSEAANLQFNTTGGGSTIFSTSAASGDRTAFSLLSRDTNKSGDASASGYEDYINYVGGYGAIQIKFSNSQNKEAANRIILLKEAFPAAISQMALASDGTAYPTFNVTFQFNSYLYL